MTADLTADLLSDVVKAGHQKITSDSQNYQQYAPNLTAAIKVLWPWTHEMQLPTSYLATKDAF